MVDQPRRYESVGQRLGSHCDTANQKYSSPHANLDALRWSTLCMEALWPKGIPANKVWVAGVLGRILDKLYRMAHSEDNTGAEDAFADLGGYAIRAYDLWAEKRPEKTP